MTTPHFGPLPQPSAPLHGSKILPRTLRNAQIIGDLWSANFEEGVSGWIIKDNGDVEFNDGIFRGTLTTAEVIVGEGVNSTELAKWHGINIDRGTDTNLFMQDIDTGRILFRVNVGGSAFISFDSTASTPLSIQGKFSTAGSGARIEMDPNAGAATLRLFDAFSDEYNIFAAPSEITVRAGTAVGDTQLRLLRGSGWELVGSGASSLQSGSPLNFFVGGIQEASLTAGQLAVRDGGSSPQFTWIGDLDTGLERDAVNGFRVLAGNTIVMQFRTTQVAVPTMLNIASPGGLAMNDRRLYFRGSGDDNHSLIYSASLDAPHLRGWSKVGFLSVGHAIRHTADSDGIRAVNDAGSAWANHRAASHFNMSDPKWKSRIARSKRKVLAEARAVEVIEHQWMRQPGLGRWIGVRSTDLPDVVAQEADSMDDGSPGGVAVSTAAMDAWLLKAIQELAEELDEANRRIAILEAA